MRWYSMVCMQKTGAGGNVARRLRWPCRRHGARGRGADAWDGGEGLTDQAGLGEGPAWGRAALPAGGREARLADPDIGCALARPDFDAMAAMEARFYGEDLITPAQEAWRWYERHPFTALAARDALGRIAGFVNLFPVRAAVYEALLAGAFNDADLTADDVADPWQVAPAGARRACPCPAPDLADAPARPPALHMLLSCVVVDAPWQGGGLAYRLVARAAAQYADVAPRISDVLIDTATPAGAKFARNLGFVPLCASDHGTLVWRCGWQAFLYRLV